MFPCISLNALEMQTSDHVPLILSLRKPQNTKGHNRMELFWLRYPEVQKLIQQVWYATVHAEGTSITIFEQRTRELYRLLKEWHRRQFSEMKSQLDSCKEAIMFFDKIEESRPLDQREFKLRISLRERRIS